MYVQLHAHQVLSGGQDTYLSARRISETAREIGLFLGCHGTSGEALPTLLSILLACFLITPGVDLLRMLPRYHLTYCY